MTYWEVYGIGYYKIVLDEVAVGDQFVKNKLIQIFKRNEYNTWRNFAHIFYINNNIFI